MVLETLDDEAVTTDINAIGYRSTDNLIYGLNPSGAQLYRIDAAGKIDSMGQPTGDELWGVF